MKKPHPARAARLYTQRATLCTLGLKARSLKLFYVIGEYDRIRQKAIKYTPLEKLQDAFIAILAGAHGLCEVNTRVRGEAAVQRSFDRQGSRWCRRLLTVVARRTCGRWKGPSMPSSAHTLRRTDTTTRPGSCCWTKPDGDAVREGGDEGLLQPRARYGRQTGWVAAPAYHEVVADRLYTGNLQLRDTLPHLVEALERTLELG